VQAACVVAGKGPAMSVVVRQSKKGWLEVDIRVRLPDGSEVRERKKAPCTSRKAAERWGEQRAAQFAVNGPPRPKKEVPTLEEFKARFIRDYVKANRLKASGIAHKETYLRLYLIPVLGKERLDAISNADVQRLKSSMEGKSAKTVNNALTVLGKMLRVALEWDVLDVMPCTVRLLKTKHPEMEFYEEDEYARLVEGATKAEDRALITVLLGGDAGLRSGEMTALEWTDIDVRRSLLHVNRAQWKEHVGSPKGGKSRTVNMTTQLIAALKAHRHLKGPRVLYSDDGSVADRDALSSWIRRAERRAGLKVTGRLHILRHTFCSRLAMRGATAKAIQELAGHVSLSTTQRYMHLSPAAKENAIRMLDGPIPGTAFGDSLETGAGEGAKH